MFFKNKILSGWGNIPKSPTKIASVVSVEELRSTLNENKIIPRGLGRSYADQSTNRENFAIDFTSFDHFLSFDDDMGVLECESGTSFEKIIEYMVPKGWFPIVSPGTKFITIGGAIANDVHGKGHHVDGSFINCVESFKILLANGKIVEASRINNADLFYSNFGGLGLLGFILSAKIRLRRIDTTYFSQINIVARNLDEMLENLHSRDKDYAFSVAWIDSLAKGKNLGRGVLSLGNFAQIDELPFKKMINPLHLSRKSKIGVPFYFPSFALNNVTVKILNKALFYRQRSGTGVTDYDSFFYPLDMIRHWNRGYGKRGFIQYQFVLPFEKGKENIRKIMEAISGSGHSPFLNVLKKFGKCDSGPLSFPMEGYTFAIDFPYSDMLGKFTRKLDDMVLEAGGRIYLGKDAMLSEEHFKQMYPQYEEWMKVKEKYDPDNLFSSDLSRRIGLC